MENQHLDGYASTHAIFRYPTATVPLGLGFRAPIGTVSRPLLCPTVRFASLPWYDLAEVQSAHDALWTAVASRLRGAGVADVPAQLERDLDYVGQWHSGRLLLGQACGYDVATWQSKTLRVLGTPHFGFEGCDGPQYRSFVVVREESAARSLLDLRGARCVINTETSHSGMNTLRTLVEPLRSSGPFFDRVRVSGAHEHSVAMVAAGEADVAAIDCITYGLLQRHRPAALDSLRVIAESDLAPAPPFVTSASTSLEEVEVLRAALVEVIAEAAPSWSALRLTGLSPLPVAAYASMSLGVRPSVALGAVG